MIPQGSCAGRSRRQRAQLRLQDRHRRRQLRVRQRGHANQAAFDLLGLVAPGAAIGMIGARQVQLRRARAPLPRRVPASARPAPACARQPTGTATPADPAKARTAARRASDAARAWARRGRRPTTTMSASRSTSPRDLPSLIRRNSGCVVGLDADVGVDRPDGDGPMATVAADAERLQDPLDVVGRQPAPLSHARRRPPARARPGSARTAPPRRPATAANRDRQSGNTACSPPAISSRWRSSSLLMAATEKPAAQAFSVVS